MQISHIEVTPARLLTAPYRTSSDQCPRNALLTIDVIFVRIETRRGKMHGAVPPLRRRPAITGETLGGRSDCGVSGRRRPSARPQPH